MHNTTSFGRALKGDEIHQARMLDALIAYRTHSGLRMDADADAAAAATAAAEKAASDKAAADKAAADAAAAAAADGMALDKDGRSLGYPKDTPVAEMTADQKAAYGKAKDEERRAATREWKSVTGDRTPAQLKADLEELDKLKKAGMTEGEKAITEAKEATRAEVALESVRAAFDLLLPDDMSDEDKEAKLEVLNLKAFLTADGKVDTAKVKTHAATIAPAKGTQQDRDFGQGRRGGGSGKTGVSAGADMFAEKRGKKTPTNS